jgi:acyl-CoA reductase-like NAD-dependent aldehyde dehydrogenase
VDAIAFTGSSAIGRRIMESAARSLKRFVGELGGSAPTLIFADCDLDRAIEGTLLCAFANNGEACVAGSRLLVERPLLPAFLDRFTARVRRITVGDPLDVHTEVGPLISRAHRERIVGLIHEALGQGARLACGQVEPPLSAGFYLQPSVVIDVPATARLSSEEVLGPVVTVTAFDSEDNVIRDANASPYGLAAYVWTQSPERLFRVAQRLRSGTVWANTSLVRDIRVPFGGYKQSGVGRIGGGFSINAFTEVKNTCVTIEPLRLPRLGNR